MVMNNEEYICHKCAKIVNPDQVNFHPIRGGYTREHFPLFHFDKKPLCAECLVRQKKIDSFEKVLAGLGLAIVFYFMVIGFIILFSSRG